jgi:hypothetical protein
MTKIQELEADQTLLDEQIVDAMEAVASGWLKGNEVTKAFAEIKTWTDQSERVM